MAEFEMMSTRCERLRADLNVLPVSLRDLLFGLYLAPFVLLIALACRALERFAPLLLGEERMGH